MKVLRVEAILFDTRSIQHYIFSGNELKTNIGASYLVDRLFSDILVKEILYEKLHYIQCPNDWKSSEESEMEKDCKLKCEVAYIGGGNALILLNRSAFLSGEKALSAQDIVGLFTKRVLTYAPGLRTNVAIGALVLGEGDKAFKDSLAELYRRIKQNQNMICPQVNISYTGLTLLCDHSGETADARGLEDGKPRYISSELHAKKHAVAHANVAWAQRFEAVLKQQDGTYTFPILLETLGQIETEDYVAVVHIDGNNMGAKFSNCRNLQERRILSRRVATLVEKSFQALLKHIIDRYEIYCGVASKQGKKLFALQQRQLPIRPLILGGDDITFVCMSRVALDYVKFFIEEMHKGGMHCCAGIAILSTKYPFSRAYQLAQQLCVAAKAKARNHKISSKGKESADNQPMDSSWLDYAIIHGETAATLEQMRQREYTGALGNLHFGPYVVGQPAFRFSVEKLMQGIAQLRSLPHNKVKEMRLVLSKGKDDIDAFMQQFIKAKHCLPNIKKFESYESELWHNGKTPYVDMIEMMEFTVPQEEATTNEA